MNNPIYNYDDLSVIKTEIQFYAKKLLYVNFISPGYLFCVFFAKKLLKIPYILLANIFYSLLLIAIYIITLLFVREYIDRVKFLNQKKTELNPAADNEVVSSKSLLLNSPNTFLKARQVYLIMHSVFLFVAMYFLWR